MTEIFILRTLSWLCLICSMLVPFKGIEQEIPFLLVVYGLCMVTAAVSYKLKEHDRLRFLPAVLPMLSLLLTKTYSLWIAAALMTGYFVYIAISEKYDTVFWEYQRAFFRGLVIAIIACIIYMIVVNFCLHWEIYYPYAFLLGFVILGSFILRELRLGNTHSRQVKILNLAMLFGTCILAVVLAGGIGLVGMLDWEAIENVLLLPLGVLLELFTRFIIFVTKKPVQGFWEQHTKANKVVKNLPEQKPWGERRFQEKEKIIENDAIYGNVMLGIFVLIGIIILAVLLFFLIRYIKDHLRPSYYGGDNDTLTFENEYYFEKRKKKERGARGKLRNIYRQYLHYNLGQGIRIRQSDTSGDVMDKNEAAFGERPLEKELRNLYVKTRYVEDYEPTANEVRRAKQLLKQLKVRNEKGKTVT